VKSGNIFFRDCTTSAVGRSRSTAPLIDVDSGAAIAASGVAWLKVRKGFLFHE